MKARTARFIVLILGLGTLWLAWTTPGLAAPTNDAQWIWSPAHTPGNVPAGDCVFRKSFRLKAPEEAQIDIACEDAYELYVNGRRVGSGDSWKRLDSYNVIQFLTSGTNVVAVKATKKTSGSAGLVARVIVKQQGGTHVAFSTDSTWKTSLLANQHWYKTSLNDSAWTGSRSLGALGEAKPWGQEVQTAGPRGRFRVLNSFRVEWVASPEETGSLIAMTFNEFGQIIASQENGPLLLVTDSDKDGAHDKVSVYCDQVKNCQGLLALNGKILATGDGPDGAALYRITDVDRNGVADSVEPMIRFQGKMGEHGPHALTLGPDGLIYLMAGNHTQLDAKANPPSDEGPYRHFGEGDLLQPRYEDPGGHALGVQAPGGIVLRTNAQGTLVERFAGGLRNAYDLAFDRDGNLFTFDSDMESNRGLPWYRPTRVLQLIPGSESGWRSGWAKMPNYYLDNLAPIYEHGGGSPAGMVFYNHFAYPVRFHNAMFVCDWSRGRIEVLQFEPAGASFRVRARPFVEGRPLNATDIDVGPDGLLYFCTGGRGTEGGIYCVTWSGRVPPQVSNLGEGLQRALRQPQLNSAWARQRIALVKKRLGDRWDSELTAVANDRKRSTAERLRALDLMQLIGPFPPSKTLVALSHDRNPAIRRRVAFLMGIHGDERTHHALAQLLDDPRADVRRVACEAIARSDSPAPVTSIVRLLGDRDPFVAFAARRVLETRPVDTWRAMILDHQRTQVFLHGATALLAVEGSKNDARDVLGRAEQIIIGNVRDPGHPVGFVSDRDFTNLLRVIQLAFQIKGVESKDFGKLREALAQEYPSSDHLMNRELVRLLCYLQAGSVTSRMIEQLQSDIPSVEKMHLVAHVPFLKTGWNTEQKLALLNFYEASRSANGGKSMAPYVDRFVRDFVSNLVPEEQLLVIKGGVRWPTAAFALLGKLPQPLSQTTLRELVQLDGRLAALEGETITRLQTGIVAALARSERTEAMDYLRQVFRQYPERRMTVMAGLAQQPDGENWPLLVQSLPIVEGAYARELLTQLAGVDRVPEDPEAFRQAILCGLRLEKDGGQLAAQLLAHWTRTPVHGDDQNWQTSLSKWQAWFSKTYPEKTPAVLPTESDSSKWTYEELLTFLSGPQGHQGDSQHGSVVFEKAQCGKCHRFGNQGEGLGPDLTSVGRRFQTKEILESIVFPSHVISDQYAGKKIVTQSGKTLSGVVTPQGPRHLMVLQSNGEAATVAKDEIDVMLPSRQSTMPDGLLDPLTLEEIADLFAYLQQQPRTNITSRRRETK